MSQEPIQVLLVEDNPDHAELIRRALERQSRPIRVTIVTDGVDCLETLRHHSYSAVLLDYSLSGMDGLTVLKKIRQQGSSVPVIMVTGQGDEEVVVEAMEEGASDYLIKTTGYLTTLPAMLFKVLKQHELALDNVRLYEETKRAAEMQRFLKELSQDITSLDIDSLLKKLTERVQDVLKVDIVDVRVMEQSSWRLKAVSGIESERLYLRSPGEVRGRARWIIENRRPLAVSDITGATDIPIEESVSRLGVCGYLGVPFLSRSGEVIGVIRALTYQPRVFSQEEIDLLQQLANGAAIALENTRLFEEVQKKSQELQEAFRTKSEFLNTMAHELRIPLNVIIGNTQLLEDGFYGPLGEKVHQASAIIGKSARDLLQLLNEVLDLARLEAKGVPLRLGEIPIKEIVDDLKSSFMPLAREKGLDLKIRLDGTMPALKSDRSKITEVLQNLLANAVKYTDKGEIELQVCSPVEGGVDKGEWVSFSVRDTGIGIKGEDLPRIFEPFHIVDGVDRKKYPGTGLGLSIVRNMVELLKGKIQVESELGKGSTFTVTLPLIHPNTA